jgi:hypothetical protein
LNSSNLNSSWRKNSVNWLPEPITTILAFFILASSSLNRSVLDPRLRQTYQVSPSRASDLDTAPELP